MLRPIETLSETIKWWNNSIYQPCAMTQRLAICLVLIRMALRQNGKQTDYPSSCIFYFPRASRLELLLCYVLVQTTERKWGERRKQKHKWKNALQKMKLSEIFLEHELRIIATIPTNEGGKFDILYPTYKKSLWLIWSRYHFFFWTFSLIFSVINSHQRFVNDFFQNS